MQNNVKSTHAPKGGFVGEDGGHCRNVGACITVLHLDLDIHDILQPESVAVISVKCRCMCMNAQVAMRNQYTVSCVKLCCNVWLLWRTKCWRVRRADNKVRTESAIHNALELPSGCQDYICIL